MNDVMLNVQWEYLTATNPTDRDMTRMGRHRWELVAITTTTAGARYVFKRELIVKPGAMVKAARSRSVRSSAPAPSWVG